MKSWLIGKDSDAGRDWGQEEKGTTEDEMAGREFAWTPGVGDGQGGLACCKSWGHKESDMTEQLNWTDYIYIMYLHLNLCAFLITQKDINTMYTWPIVISMVSYISNLLELAIR